MEQEACRYLGLVTRRVSQAQILSTQLLSTDCPALGRPPVENRSLQPSSPRLGQPSTATQRKFDAEGEAFCSYPPRYSRKCRLMEAIRKLPTAFPTLCQGAKSPAADIRSNSVRCASRCISSCSFVRLPCKQHPSLANTAFDGSLVGNTGFQRTLHDQDGFPHRLQVNCKRQRQRAF